MASNRDFTKYLFEGKTMGKGPLVLALVKRYVRDHPLSKFEEVHTAFPDRLQAQSPVQFDKIQCVVRRLRDIPEASLVRFFRNEEDRLHFGADVVLVSREWNVDNIQNVLAHAEKLGYVVTCA
jgi:hypothetical protein